MAHDVTERKFNILFDWFDQTDDDWLTREDFEQMGELFAALARSDDHENRKAMRDAFIGWWDTLCATGSADSQQRVGRKEFVDVMRSHVTQPENFRHIVLPIADALMRALDVDGSGVLSFEEYVRMYDAIGVSPATSTEAFRRLDRNGSGSITLPEFRTAIEEFYLSADPEAPGSWLIGKPLTE
jgi:Ca2+-binding EF-hand superfamily protein